ncbi:MAG: NUDIX hydrolase [Planctomycetota bacterium]|jgi:ADP-ribose pyrophosphatase|nr:NUDIX hydrolase [Planctomycetota bacterium]MDP6940010.1 NUDIX hydrolase [Planctomycetota bacterium]
MELTAIEIVGDRTATSRCDEGYIKVARLDVRNVYSDGSTSKTYSCDVMSRPQSDAVVAVLYALDGEDGIEVVLREAPRVPIYLRRDKEFVHPDPREYLSLHEVVAGVVEASDPAGIEGLRVRAHAEALEEAGVTIDPGDFQPLGDESFASPGVTDEKIYFVAGHVPSGQEAATPQGDGSTMEEWCVLHRFELGRAIEACRTGEIPDMKTEVALLRLADYLGWIPQLRCFRADLPPELAARYSSLGLGS